MYQLSCICTGPEATATVAGSIAPLLRTGDVLLLSGGLAAGKTSFVTALVAALGSDARVSSPTFGIAHFYRTKAGTLLHIDAYRLSGGAEYRDLALGDYVSESITAVEWGEKIATEFSDFLLVTFDFVNNHEESRKLTLSSSAVRWNTDLHALRSRLLGVLT